MFDQFIPHHLQEYEWCVRESAPGIDYAIFVCAVRSHQKCHRVKRFSHVLQEMYDRGQGDDGTVFAK